MRPPEVLAEALVPDCTPYLLDAIALPASLLDCFKGALAGLLGFFSAG